MPKEYSGPPSSEPASFKKDDKRHPVQTCKHCGQSYRYQHTCKGGKGD